MGGEREVRMPVVWAKGCARNSHLNFSPDFGVLNCLTAEAECTAPASGAVMSCDVMMSLLGSLQSRKCSLLWCCTSIPEEEHPQKKEQRLNIVSTLGWSMRDSHAPPLA